MLIVMYGVSGTFTPYKECLNIYNQQPLNNRFLRFELAVSKWGYYQICHCLFECKTTGPRQVCVFSDVFLNVCVYIWRMNLFPTSFIVLSCCSVTPLYQVEGKIGLRLTYPICDFYKLGALNLAAVVCCCWSYVLFVYCFVLFYCTTVPGFRVSLGTR